MAAPFDHAAPSQGTLGLHNPAALPPQQLLAEFVAREHHLAEALRALSTSGRGQPPQHLLFLGGRGMGKTTLLLAIAYRVEGDPDLASDWLPLLFPEEAHYGIGDLADLWLLALDLLLERLGRDPEPLAALRAGPEVDLEVRALNLLLQTADSAGKRLILMIENLGDFFHNLSDETAQHRLRELLMREDRLLLICSATAYFAEVASVDKPFFEFFRPLRLERFTREETFAALRRVAESRGNTAVPERLQAEPDRIDSLRVLTGGNPRLIKGVYRLLEDGPSGDVRRDLERLLDDYTPYFKHRIESLSGEQRRVFDLVAKRWDPVHSGDLEAELRRSANKISTYLGRLVDEGFLEEVLIPGERRKHYQVAERFYNIYYLMRFSRNGRRRLEWLGRFMQILYRPEDYRQWVERVLSAWSGNTDAATRSHYSEYLHALTGSAPSPELKRELAELVIDASWVADHLSSLRDLLDSRVAESALGSRAPIVEYLAAQDPETRRRISYRPKFGPWWYRLAEELEKAGQPQLALVAAEQSVALSPTYGVFWNLLGLLHMKLRRFADAEAALRKSIESDPGNSMPWNNLGLLLQAYLGRPKEAEQAYRIAIRHNPQSFSAWFGLGVVLERDLNALEGAAQAFQRCVDIEPVEPEARAALARTLLRLGNPQAARLPASYALAAAPVNPRYRALFLEAHKGTPVNWRAHLPSLIATLAEKDNPDLLEFTIQALAALLASRSATPAEAANLITSNGTPPALNDLLIALQSVKQPDLLLSIAPERRTAAQDFLKRLQPGTPVPG